MLPLKVLEKIRPKKLRILFVSTEAEPFAISGGLGTVMHSLPRALRKLGHDARLMIPRYLSVDPQKWQLKIAYEGLQVPTENQKGPKELICNVKRYDPKTPDDPVTTYFLENKEYYEQRANIYGYADDSVRWALLCRGTLEFLKKSDWVPEVIVVTDWHSGRLPNLLKTVYQDDPKLSQIATVLSIHNLRAQGSFDYRFLTEADIDDGYSLLPSFEDPRLLKVNGMRRGIIYADVINTVSETYAKEITTPIYGQGLDELLRKRQDVLTGIINGIDYSNWIPETDPLVPHKFSVKNLPARAKNKAALQKRFELPVTNEAFVVGIVARMVPQKGIDLLETIIQQLLQELPLQLVVLGEGESRIMELFLNLKKIFPENVAAHFKFEAELPHLIFAGADAVLIPSRFEPSGLTQMEAMAYGCIPIVRKTGGLGDTVEDYSPEKDAGTGFVFEKIDAQSLMIAIVRAYESFRHKAEWQKLQKRAMLKDFSWEYSAKLYVDLFEKAVRLRQKTNSKSG